ncbi:uncharacterized protein LOC132305447 [Cornus florida]|uniref:uncharacterized protein LOC132305447 n=1 Tax=Cornus florida TaxID=4283 RepID=UPI0028A08386|nr:uncharacterized protein LOC132305447 [Cornus florida]
MADTDSLMKIQRLGSQLPPDYANQSKFFTHFIYKAVFFTIFLVVIPLFPLETPEFISTTLQTRSWELLQITFVGIAISYGLFSKRTDETEKEYSSKYDSAQSFMSRCLQVSSVFDDETEGQYNFNDHKVQTWNSQYCKGEPVVVVAQQSSVLEEQRGTSSRYGEKPLFLPVRNLKSPLVESDVIESTNRSSVKTGSLRRSSLNPSSNLSSSTSTEEELDGPPLYSLPPSMEESRSFRPQTSYSPTPSISSAMKVTPLPSWPMETQIKNVEDMTRKNKLYYKSSTPPATPPPPLYIHKSPLMKSNSGLENYEASSEKELKRSVLSVPKDLNRASSGSKSRTRTQNDGLLMARSVRTIRAGEPVDGMNAKAEKRSKEVEATGEFFHESVPVVSKSTFSEYGMEEKRLFDKVVVGTDEESDSEAGDFEGDLDSEEVASNNVGDGGPDVDKKADEFIAKFRHQIRLQRIDSIKRSTTQLARDPLR